MKRNYFRLYRFCFIFLPSASAVSASPQFFSSAVNCASERLAEIMCQQSAVVEQLPLANTFFILFQFEFLISFFTLLGSSRKSGSSHADAYVTSWTNYFFVSHRWGHVKRMLFTIFPSSMPTFCRAFIYAHSMGGVSEGTKLRSNQKKRENRFPNEQRIVYLVVLIVLPLLAHRRE